MKKIFQIIVPLVLSVTPGPAQDRKQVEKEEIRQAEKAGAEVIYGRPFNVFISAGIGVRMEKHYDVTISPTDHVVQFERVSPLYSSIATGLVWNPFSIGYMINEDDGGSHYELKRIPFAVSLLINVFNLSFGEANSASPIDVGFGLGYRKEDFLVMGTLEFKPLRQPRKYFLDDYMRNPRGLILNGTEEPVRTISTDDNSLFITKLFPAIGIKVAYSFGSKKEEE